MKRVSFLLLFASLMLADTISTAIYHPARLMFYTLYPSAPSIKNDLSITLSETNDYEKEPYYYIDYELTALTIQKDYKLSPTFGLKLTLPLYRIWGGFLDAPLDLFHNATGTLHGYRHNQDGKNRVHLHYLKAHRTSSFSTLGNIQMELRYLLPTNIAQSITFGLKLPTARSDSGFGSGKLDYALGYQGSYKKWNFGAHIAYLGRFSTPQIRSKRVLYSAFIAYSYKKWLFQYRFLSSPFTNPHPQYDSTSNTIDIAYQKGRWSFFISENLAPFYNSPDFTLGVTYRF